jgi:protein tyrosine phosphatase domain-containing protein 1
LGLHAECVADLLIGSQRPSDRLIKEFGIIEQFKQRGVAAVINLEEPGEHPYCGDGIIPRTGFAYTPEKIMNAGVQYYNFYWKDLEVPAPGYLLHIVQIMHSIVLQGGPERKNKILVHCHAGQGRTAVVIGAYLLYSGMAKDAADAVAIAQRGRSKLFAHAYNRRCVEDFVPFLRNLRTLCPDGKANGALPSLQSVLQKQRKVLQGKD